MPSGDLPVRLQGVYVLALAFDMVPVALRARTAARLVELVHERGDRLDTGFLSTPYLLDVLCDHGYPEVARTLLWQSEMPSWLYEVDHGATTIWEAWDAISPDGEIRPMSFNHYAPGSVDDWLYRRVAGIRSTSPGYRTAVIEPDFEIGVDHVAAHVGTPYGRLAVEWTRTGDAASVVVDVPYGVAARLVTAGRARWRSRRGAARTRWRSRRRDPRRGCRPGQSCNVRHGGTVEPGVRHGSPDSSVPPQEQPIRGLSTGPIRPSDLGFECRRPSIRMEA